MTRIYENARWDNIGLDIQGNFNAKVLKRKKPISKSLKKVSIDAKMLHDNARLTSIPLKTLSEV